uniref:B30.2/SPRY domain-containing protein n=1 Tax=Mola mola TaxID=94237 RepID=A0A3Q3WGD2_MOLML
MMQCFHFMVEPAKTLTAKIKESHKKAKKDKCEPLDEDQQFVAELARDLSRVCQKSAVLEHIWKQDDTWPPSLCRAFILQWASILESKQKRPMQTDGWPKMEEFEQTAMLNTQDLLQARIAMLKWMKDLRAQPEQSVWPGEPVEKVLEDLQSAWRWGRMPNLLTAMELVMWTFMIQCPDKDTIPQQWLMWKQRTQKIAIPYIPQPWDWISDAAGEVNLDLDTANPDLLISANDKKMRCGFERKDVPNYHQRFDGWWCAVGVEGLGSGCHYWEAEVGERDWRLGVAKESALRKGFKSLNTDTGYLTLRLERGTELKALTVPFTALPPSLIPRKVGIFLDYDHGQLSFYDVDKRCHIYTYNESFAEKLFPLFGTVEIVKDLVIKSPLAKTQCLCPLPCLSG